jgi:flavin reductase (DIM6/NTAB) family NADH-FMN oxidoreductase RutF
MEGGLVTRESISFADLCVNASALWSRKALVLAAGDFAAGEYNAMTVGWGSLGYMWNRPFAQIVVRPTRYTYGFTERWDTFTLCALPAKRRDALKLLGTRSGRDGDKIAAAGLTPIASRVVAAPGFAEAELILECRKIYWDDLAPRQFLPPDIEDNYPQKDYHRIYFGEIAAIAGTPAYRRSPPA